jgi:hypothetical protein
VARFPAAGPTIYRPPPSGPAARLLARPAGLPPRRADGRRQQGANQQGQGHRPRRQPHAAHPPGYRGYPPNPRSRAWTASRRAASSRRACAAASVPGSRRRTGGLPPCAGPT